MKNLVKLPHSFIGKAEVKGFSFTQVLESHNSYIYRVGPDKDCYYEVFKKKESAICLDFLKREYSETDFMENYPKKNAFGVTAWTTGNLFRAQEIMTEIEFRIAEKEEERKLISKNKKDE
jgi:hypothetical protein